jgi:hypothetical protein
MLVIRKQQMDALAEYSRRAFRKRMARRLGASHPARFGGVVEAAEQFVESQVARALQYGIQDEGDLQGYVDLAAELGEDFDERPETQWVRDILLKDSLSGTAKVQLIQQLK